ncbi:MAG: SDR family NAD(P)-dependent oxidoreductase [Cellvibrionales bacterium]|nr:SDR family NAD(P)-dependent oxidoreductase [Cellvibrionales bacterium]
MLVTGASGGIGSAVAEEMARQGALFLLVGRDASMLEKVQARIAAHGGSRKCWWRICWCRMIDGAWWKFVWRCLAVCTAWSTMRELITSRGWKIKQKRCCNHNCT